jgi:7,8-dihydropterin-6-yl-methyl-4-(beta-D-ribofuranosyl)aminobenzene 5'-phosphate synthase
MLRALQLVRDRNGGREIPCYVHPDMFRSRAARMPDGSFRPMEDIPSEASLTAHGGQVISTRDAQVIAGSSVYVSGEIPRRSGFEVGLPGQHRRTLDNQGWELDELLVDERFVAVHVRGKGLVVLTACSHAGVINVLTHARDCFPGVKLHAVLGGLHLSGINERIIPQTIAALGKFDLDVIAAGHCTGWRAMTALANAFGDGKLVPLAVGKRMRF